MGVILRMASALLVCVAATAASQPSARQVMAPGPRLAHNCQCLAGDRRYAQGEVACIRGQRMRCGMSLNNSSWLPLEGGCQENRLSMSPLPRRSPSLHPHVIGMCTAHFA